MGLSLGIVAAGLLLASSKKEVKGKVFVRDITNTLPIHSVLRYSKRNVSVVDQIIIHHSLTLNGSATAFANYHINTRGWPGIGYHFVINKNGSIDQTNNLDTISYHATGQNTRSIGICLVGNYDQQTIPEAQFKSCVILCRNLNIQLGKSLTIEGHKKYSSKSCPGKNTNIQLIKSLI